MNRFFVLPALALSAVLASGANSYAFCGLLGGMCGNGCCEVSCGCEAESCEPSCGCETDCCRPRCGLFGGLRGLLRCNQDCCEASCGCEAEPNCGCGG